MKHVKSTNPDKAKYVRMFKGNFSYPVRLTLMKENAEHVEAHVLRNLGGKQYESVGFWFIDKATENVIFSRVAGKVN
jgi:hypothetical protein